MTLHNAIDEKYFLLGGCATGSDEGLEESVFITSAITSWMSVAASTSSQEDRNQLVDHLENVLETQSFVVRSPGVTLADLDLFFLLKNHGVGEEKVNVCRWLRQVHASALGFTKVGSLNRPDLVKYMSLDELPAVRSSPPVFFYGFDGECPIQSTASKKKAAPTNKESKDKPKDAPKPKAPSKGGELTEEQKKAAAEKRAKKNAAKAKKKQSQPTPAPKVELNISALDIRVGKILKVWNHETADKLYCEEIDVGEPTPRKIASGLRPFYKLEDLDQKMVLVLCNLKSRSLVGFPSHGMVLCASNSDHTSVQLMAPSSGSKIGERVLFDGYRGDPESESKMNKKKIFEGLAPELKTDSSGGLIWKEAKGGTVAGQCFAIQNMADAHVA